MNLYLQGRKINVNNIKASNGRFDQLDIVSFMHASLTFQGKFYPRLSGTQFYMYTY